MPNYATDDDIGPPGKPLKHRRFPWRLWLYALIMTAAAGAGGYFAWFYRGEAETAATEVGACNTSLAAERATCPANLKAAQDDAAKSKTAFAALAAEAGKLKNERDQIAKNLTVSKDELVAVRTAKEQAEARIKAVDDIQKQFAKMIDTGALKVSSRRGSLVLSLPAEVLFPSGVADLSEEGRIKVLEVAFHLKQHPDRRFLVVGHTDSQPPQKNSAYRDNWDLSVARALTVTRVLVQGGMEKKHLIPAGASEYDELVPNTSAASMQRNRRIEIVLLPALGELPPLPASLEQPAEKTAPAPAPAKKP